MQSEAYGKCYQTLYFFLRSEKVPLDFFRNRGITFYLEILKFLSETVMQYLLFRVCQGRN